MHDLHSSPPRLVLGAKKKKKHNTSFWLNVSQQDLTPQRVILATQSVLYGQYLKKVFFPTLYNSGAKVQKPVLALLIVWQNNPNEPTPKDSI